VEYLGSFKPPFQGGPSLLKLSFARFCMPLPVRNYDRTVNYEVERILYQIQVILQEADGLVYGLTPSQWSWRPSGGGWSIIEHLEHLNITNRSMIANIEAAITKARAAYGFLSRWFMRLLEPPVRRKFKAPKKFTPPSQLSPDTVMESWRRSHQDLIRLAQSANGLNLSGIKVPSPALKWLKYELGAAFWVSTLHDKRHLWHIRQIVVNPAFKPVA
jgi:hypothetical protein